MDGHSRRFRTSLSSPSSDPGFTIPLSSERLIGWRRFFSSLSSPFLSNSGADRTFRVVASRFTPRVSEDGENAFQTAELPNPLNQRERQRSPNLLGHWSSDDIYTRREILPLNQLRRNSLGTINISDPINTQNVVINMEGNIDREIPNRLASSSNNGDIVDNSSNSNDSDSGNQTGDDNQQGDENGNSVRINGESISEMLDRHPEVCELLKALWQYCIFILIIFTKVIFDRFSSLLILLAFAFGFFLSNKVVKIILSQPAAAVTPKHALGLSTVFVLIPLGIFLFYHNTSSKMYYSAILLPSDYEYLTLGDLMWIVIITDYVLKLVTVLLKGFYAAVPCVFVHHKQRGKHLALVEISSQLYRSLAPVQPWLSYLLDNYTGIQKVFGVFLSAVYMLCKGPDIIQRIKNFHYVFKKFMERANYGCTPTQAQLKVTGSVCPICQDDFVVPTMLQCKHIFCEQCVARWFDRERTCPMCRTKVADDPKFRDGSTSHAVQLY